MKKQSILAILIAALLVLTIFTGCAANSKMAAADTASAPNGYYDSKQEAAAAETPMEAPAEPEEEFAYDTVATTEAGGGAAETPEPDDSVADYTEKIIYTASVSIETTEFDKAVAALESQVQKIGGFVESSNVTGDTQYNSDGTTSIVIFPQRGQAKCPPCCFLLNSAMRTRASVSSCGSMLSISHTSRPSIRPSALLICCEYGGGNPLAVVTIAIGDRPKPVLHGVPHFLLCSSSISSRVASRTSNSSIIF